MSDPAGPYVTTRVTRTRRCPVCGELFPAVGRQIFCGHPCRQVAYRQRIANTALDDTPRPIARVPIIYQCTSCEQRYLDERRCPDCHLYCRRLGPGGPCPYCDEPVAVTDITDTRR